MAAAVPFAPMIIGAGAGALMDKGNPIRGAMLGAVGGSVAGPAMSALTAPGAAAAGAAGAAGAAPGVAGSYGAALGSAVPGMAGAGAGQQAAMLAAQTGGMGTQGLAHTMGSFGVEPLAAKATSMATMGPQGLFAGGLSKNNMMGLGKGFFGRQDLINLNGFFLAFYFSRIKFLEVEISFRLMISFHSHNDLIGFSQA